MKNIFSLLMATSVLFISCEADYREEGMEPTMVYIAQPHAVLGVTVKEVLSISATDSFEVGVVKSGYFDEPATLTLDIAADSIIPAGYALLPADCHNFTKVDVAMAAGDLSKTVSYTIDVVKLKAAYEAQDTPIPFVLPITIAQSSTKITEAFRSGIFSFKLVDGNISVELVGANVLPAADEAGLSTISIPVEVDFENKWLLEGQFKIETNLPAESYTVSNSGKVTMIPGVNEGALEIVIDHAKFDQEASFQLSATLESIACPTDESIKVAMSEAAADRTYSTTAGAHKSLNRTLWTYVFSSDVGPSNWKKMSVDGKDDTFWLTSPTDEAPYIIYDMKSSYTVSSISILPRHDAGDIANRYFDGTIEVSSDNVTFSKFVDFELEHVVKTQRFKPTAAVKARYVKLTANPKNILTTLEYAQVAEFNVQSPDAL